MYGLALETSRFDKGCNTKKKVHARLEGTMGAGPAKVHARLEGTMGAGPAKVTGDDLVVVVVVVVVVMAGEKLGTI